MLSPSTKSLFYIGKELSDCLEHNQDIKESVMSVVYHLPIYTLLYSSEWLTSMMKSWAREVCKPVLIQMKLKLEC